MTRKQVWTPRQLPQIHPALGLMYGIPLLVSLAIGALLVGVTSSFGFYLVKEHAVTVYSSIYYNMSMGLKDEIMYDFDLVS